MLSMWVYDDDPERPVRRVKHGKPLRDRLTEHARESARRACDTLSSEDEITVPGAVCPAPAS